MKYGPVSRRSTLTRETKVRFLLFQYLYLFMISPLFLIPITTLLFINTIGFFFKSFGVFGETKILGTTLNSVIKITSLLSLNVNLAYSIILWKLYPVYIGNHLYYPSNGWFELQHNLNLPFVILSVLILIIALLTSWYSKINIQLFLNLLLIIEICLIGSFSCLNLFIFLLFFEASAIPVFILIVYCGSDRRERLKASYYFLFFTMYGSISLLLVLINLYAYQNNKFIDFPALSGNSGNYSSWVLMFIAFSVKIPLFPFHLWLPFAHVEASTSTSILLAALMLKLGGYGILKFMLPLFSVDVHLFFRPFATFICSLGVLYGGLGALRQVDLKRQIAFSSISHMGFSILTLFTFTEVGVKAAVYLMLSHGLTSASLFYLVGVLSERYHTRSIMAYGGLLGSMPIFSCFFIIISLANVGFPGTSGFLPELFGLLSIVSTFPLLLVPVLLGMFIATCSTLLLVLRLLFGHTKLTYTRSTFSDITKMEIIILTFLSFFIIVVGLVDVLSL